jgi:hypothetical protein
MWVAKVMFGMDSGLTHTTLGCVSLEPGSSYAEQLEPDTGDLHTFSRFAECLYLTAGRHV